jgi:hypothetical protein
MINAPAGFTVNISQYLGPNFIVLGTFTAGNGLFQIAATNTGTSHSGLVQMVDSVWAPSGNNSSYTYNNYINQTLGSVNLVGGTIAQRWNTSNSLFFQTATGTSATASSHILSNTVALYIAAGAGDGGGGAFDLNGVPTNPYYQEIGSLSYSAVILSPGHYNEGVASYFYDNQDNPNAIPPVTGTAVAAKSVNFFSAMVKNSATNTYLTYGYQAYSFGTQQTTYSPFAGYRVDGGWQAGLDLSGLTYGPGILDKGTHTYALDTNGGTFSGGPIRLGNNAAIVARNSGNTSDVSIVNFNASSLYMGGSGVTAIFANASATFAPVLDNTIPCGLNSLRWTAVWAVNGTIQTSDPSLKTNIQPLPTALPLIMQIKPVTFNWIIGGYTQQEELVEQVVQDTATEEYFEEVVEMVNGKAVQSKVAKTREVLLWDTHQVVDEDGKPVLNRVIIGKNHAERPIYDTVPKTFQTPVMVKKLVAKQVSVEKPGKRTHWGFLADNVQEVMASTGLDFGGYVEDENGTKHLRPDQLVPVLLKAVQELAERIAVLEAR